ncbi:ribonuclease H-like domain-containing protein [Cytobacillus praedii]|uniref:ribonuclease H-like domain-containing protein n=1 Tax=Cytobacillus praedii TaxID=1742358 RepID=UPI003F7EFB59
MSIKKKLNRLKSHLSHEESAKTVLKTCHFNESVIPYLDVWEEEGVTPYFFDGSYCLIRERRFPIDQQHGIYSFSQFTTAVNAWNESGMKHPLSAAGIEPESFVFFDTETTGLGGGAGNSIFILGHARLTGEEIYLKQHILPSPGAEVPLYQSFLESADYTTMATYNGKSFDWPQVKTQHTLIREHVPKLPSFGHFDLYHASRRMWKHKLERMKLSIVEKEVLGIERKDDLPGFLAPMIYFDFVERKDPQGMLGILKHNEIDILSLISLYTHLSFQILGLDQKRTAKEMYEIGRWFSHVGNAEAAKVSFSRLASSTNNEAIAAKHALAFEYKKEKKWTDALHLWEDVVDEGEDEGIRLEACIELAKIFEHREKDLQKAIDFTKIAEASFQNLQSAKYSKKSISYHDIMKRLERLNKRLYQSF